MHSSGNCLCFTTPNMAPCQSISALPDHRLYKNRLQEHAQKSSLPLPVYQTINEGFPHAPKFRSTVVVDGKTYTSNLTFCHRKAAEQDVAKQALESIEKTIKVTPPITNLEFQDPMGYKSILHEYATKSGRKIASYRTGTEGGLGKVFISSVLFDSKVYTGQVSGSKKEAEQLAARAAIRELLGSDVGNLLYEIVKSKGKLHSNSPSVNELSKDFQPEIPSQQLRNIPPSITNLNSSDRVMSPPITEEKCIMETQSWESGKRLIDCGRMMDSKREGKNMFIETQNAESMKKVNPSCPGITSQYAGAKRASETPNTESNKKVNPSCPGITSQYAAAKLAGETQIAESKKKVNSTCPGIISHYAGAKRAGGTQNAETKKIFNSSCAGMTSQYAETKKIVNSSCAGMKSQYAGAKRPSETQNAEPMKRANNSFTRMTGPAAKGKQKMEALPSLEQKNRFNSLGIMVGPNREDNRKFHTQNQESRKIYNLSASSGRMISPYKMERTTRIQHQKFESKRKSYIGLDS